MFQQFSHISIAGVTAALPNKCEKIDELLKNKNKQESFKIKRTAALAGLQQRYIASENIFTKDLAITAGRHLLESLQWDANSIDAIFFISQTPSFLMPATAYFIHHDLMLSEECIVTDISASCSGMIQGLWTAASHISKECKRVLVFAGDTMSKLFTPDDIGNIILFGDAVGVIALEFNESKDEKLSFLIRSYPDVDAALVANGSGLERRGNVLGFHMVGEKIAEFSQTRPIENITSLVKFLNLSLTDIDMLFLHQPNLSLLAMLIQQLGLPKEKIPITVSKYGNCSSANIPLVLCSEALTQNKAVLENALFCGFGGGLSVASMHARLDMNKCFPIIFHEEA